ncbi:UDP-galactopyranose mutase, partial [Paracoccus sp. APAP_BH8]|uniref:UDP-galactopyranose mutase n=1 Tax=Paracoccus sp. APAP_BH8 TaxID=3110237 RepID=UPI002FD7DA27
ETRPDILLLTHFDWDHDGRALDAFAARLAEAGLDYPHRFATRPNSGSAAGPGDIPYYPIRLVEEKSLLAQYVDLAQAQKGVTFVGRLLGSTPRASEVMNRSLARIVFDSFSGLGLMASGTGFTAADLMRPGRVAQTGLDAGLPTSATSTVGTLIM